MREKSTSFQLKYLGKDSIFSHREPRVEAADRDIYDGTYWFKKADLLMKEKKKHLEENSQIHG
jgi:hypothetical protein